mmetsp:Transcript_9325/g.12999  ORF Transcript_9325/g.12999 Transcript_9325/m.12999 type:complete len:142 (-) Transcript_9325:225-650(-)
MAHLQGQDWEPVTFKKSGKKSKSTQAREAVTSGSVGNVEKKWGGGTNKSGGVYARKIEEETEDFKHRKIPVEFKKALMKARQAKKLSQKQLAQMIQVQASVIQQYENGKAIPNGQIISKLSRALNCSLPKIPKKKKVKGDD